MTKIETFFSEVELHNFKNVLNGKISFEDKGNKLSLLGIYGQNGSGKTTVVEVFSLFLDLISGSQLDEDVDNLININSNEAEVTYKIKSIDSENIVTEYIYNVVIARTQTSDTDNSNRKSVLVHTEVLKQKKNNENLRTLFSFNREHNPFYKITNIKDSKQLDCRELDVDMKVIEKLTRVENTSILFKEDFKKIIKTSQIDNLYDATNLISKMSRKMTVISNRDSALINANILMPIDFGFEERTNKGMRGIKGKIALSLNDNDELEGRDYVIAKSIIDQVNIVMPTIIPGLEINLLETEVLVDEKNNKKHMTQLRSNRNGSDFPFRYESDGIKKLFSILFSYMSAYSDPNSIVVIDELDAGIFEFLLGELLELFLNNGKGQLIFTSHNLRILEVLNSENIIFSTNNEENRYIKMKGVRATNNLRDMYLRAIQLGGQDENLYETSDLDSIRRALRKASKEAIVNDDLWTDKGVQNDADN